VPKYPKTPKGWDSSDNYWYCPGYKRPIAYSTLYAGYLVKSLSKEGGTIKDVRDRVIFDVETQKVLDAYIKRGYGDYSAKEFFCGG